MIEHSDFKEIWSRAIRVVVFKSDKHNSVDNFRGITILTIMEKIFEAVASKRHTFVNEAFEDIYEYNSGFEWYPRIW